VGILKIDKIKEEEILKEIKKGKIFIYPTDTIYGIGCDATNLKSVERIKRIKKRDKDKPLSVIASSLEWIKENLVFDSKLTKYLPGPYTLILKKKNKNFLKHVSSTGFLGVRIPDNKITRIIQASGVPFITTSVNLSGEKPVESISEIKQEIMDKVDLIINTGKLSGRPSTLIIDGKEITR
jgi:L-threonylcarbamoyladenylate synthase